MKEFLVIETRVDGFLVTAEDYHSAFTERVAGRGRQLFPQSVCRTIRENGENVVAPATNHRSTGPGTELKAVLSKFKLHPAPNCKCARHIQEMDQNGTKWCEDNIDTIVGWLKEEADRAKLPFSQIGAKILVKRAIHNAKKKLTQQKQAA